MLKRFIPYYKPHKKLFFMDMTAALIASLIGVVYPIITRTMLNDLIPQKEYNNRRRFALHFYILI